MKNIFRGRESIEGDDRSLGHHRRGSKLFKNARWNRSASGVEACCLKHKAEWNIDYRSPGAVLQAFDKARSRMLQKAPFRYRFSIMHEAALLPAPKSLQPGDVNPMGNLHDWLGE